MTWFGTVSAVSALLMGAMFGVNAYFQFATGVSWWLYVLTAALLLVGGFRTLRKMSGGLRLLGGAWGLAAGVLAVPLSAARADGATFDTAGAALFAVALAGLALTVLHKETKKA
ncbi:hypothetical protein [Terricaulis silvestris]|uniref:Uncharacterized protein n=1 Tax=Terricaulis silvestris TaxID=2686094 RepID=A0A6I6N0R5_9CAUL|nr:hypothetical protein [Terricaulis silvestris]QGZ96923.1 hypothetical protein DSM104635_03788 [Terricaulis silvestris]